MSADRPLAGVVLMLGFCLVAPLIDVAGKLAAAFVSVGMITLARYLVQGALMGGMLAPAGLDARLPRRLWGLMGLRAATSLVATFAFVAAIAVMPLADAMAIVYIHPFMVMLLAWALMGEASGPRRIAAAAAGFAGALLVIQPNLVAFGAVALLPVGAAASFAVYVLATRQLRGMHPVAMQFHTAWIAVAMGLPLMLGLGAGLGWAPAALTAVPSAQVWALLFAVGLAATVSHLCITWALRLAPSSMLAPLGYLEIPVVALFGWLVFADLPGPLALAGILLIIASGLYLIHRERLAARPVTPPVVPPGPERSAR